MTQPRFKETGEVSEVKMYIHRELHVVLVEDVRDNNFSFKSALLPSVNLRHIIHETPMTNAVYISPIPSALTNLLFFKHLLKQSHKPS